MFGTVPPCHEISMIEYYRLKAYFLQTSVDVTLGKRVGPGTQDDNVRDLHRYTPLDKES